MIVHSIETTKREAHAPPFVVDGLGFMIGCGAESEKERVNMLRDIVGIGIASIMLLTAMPLAAQERVWPVTATPITFTDVDVTRRFFGDVSSPSQIALSFNTAGCIATSLPAGTDRRIVTKGELLFSLDGRAAQIELTIALAQLEENRALAAEQEAAVQAARNGVERAENQGNLTRAVFERKNTQHAAGLTRIDELENARADLLAADNAIGTAQDTLAQHIASLNRIGVTVSRSEAEVAAAQLSHNFLELNAPVDGVMSEPTVGLGACVANGETLATITNPKDKRVDTFLPLTLINTQRATAPDVGKPVEVTSSTGQTCAGTIARLSDNVNKDVQVVAASIALDPACAEGFRLGENVEVEILVDTLTQVMALPLGAIRENSIVYLVNENEALVGVEAEVVQRNGATAYAQFDPAGATHVLTDPPGFVMEGMKVRIAEVTK